MVILQNSSGPTISSGTNTNEVVKYVRHNINPSNITYNPEKIKLRSRQVFLTFKDEEYWKKTLDRRNEQKNCGFFAKPDCAYKECGNVELQSKQLVVNSLQNIGNHFEKTEQSKLATFTQEDRDTDEIFAKRQKPSRESRHRRSCRRNDGDNGMVSIKESLEKAEKRIVSVKAGQSLHAYLEKEKDEQRRKRQEMEKSNHSLDMVLLDPLERGIVTNGIKIEQNGGISRNRPLECRGKLKFLEKLDDLLLLFTIMQNMRPRDLKTKTPLSMETLKLLRRQPINENYHSYKPTRNSMLFPTAAPLSRDLDGYRGNKLLPPLLHEAASRHSEVATPYLRRKNLQPRHKNSPVLTSASIKVDTWDDFLALDTSSNNRADSTSLELDFNMRGTSRISMQGHGKYQQNVRSRRAAPWQTKIITEVLPPWQRISQDQRDTSEKDIQCTRNQGSQHKVSLVLGRWKGQQGTTFEQHFVTFRNELKSKKHDDILESLKLSFEKTKEAHAKKMKEEIENRIDAYKKQFQVLGSRHLREKDMKTMRDAVREWRQHVNTSMARPPIWLETLKQEQKFLQLQDDPKTNEKLQNFAKHSDFKSSPFTQAKLCLLIFSLPVYELCTLSMQEAAKFFVGMIMELPEEWLHEWLHARKLLKRTPTVHCEIKQ